MPYTQPPKPTLGIQLTPETMAKNLQELQRLKTERAAVLIRLQIAREQGDLSENGAYKYAKIELGDISRKMRELQFLIQNSEILDKPKNPTTVVIGCQVQLEVRPDSAAPTTAPQIVSYSLVSKYESDPQKQKLSVESPLGTQLAGKKVGDTISLNLPRGTTHYKIITIL